MLKQKKKSTNNYFLLRKFDYLRRGVSQLTRQRAMWANKWHARLGAPSKFMTHGYQLHIPIYRLANIYKFIWKVILLPRITETTDSWSKMGFFGISCCSGHRKWCSEDVYRAHDTWFIVPVALRDRSHLSRTQSLGSMARFQRNDRARP